ncbi:porin [Thermocrinis minervae]|uniref:Short chain amide porin n=1 Tax=Thermocrinis minervae TaxID=381751 RepID=A0A1M6QW46_9AQUI|nr:porin [Thermocrinis minervae]SHK24461.1 short chain amide porin [Thermocrinis minervae]
MKKSLLAMAALMGVAILPSQAAMIRLDEDTFANTGLKLQIWAQRLGKAQNGGQDYTDFSIANARVYFSGQVNKYVQFGANLDFGLGRNLNLQGRTQHSGTNETRVNDAFINLKLMDEVQLMAGLYRVPFSRASLTDSYTYIIPTGYGWGIATGSAGNALAINPYAPFSVGTALGNIYRDAGVTLWGNIADGLVKYQLGVFDGRYDHATGALGPKDKLAFAGRIQFTPTMLGYKAEKGFTLADTYLGTQNVLTIGLGYTFQKAQTTGQPFNYSKNAKAWTVDAMWEQKFQDFVPNLQLGYINQKDVANAALPNVNYGKAEAFYVQGQLLYDQVVGLGKPALAIRWEQNKNKSLAQYDTTTGTVTAVAGTPKVTRTGVFLNYYIKGQDAKIQLGADFVNLNSDAKANVPNGKNFTDWTLALQTQF